VNFTSPDKPAQIRSFNQGNRNGQDAQSLIRTAEANLNQTTAVLTRLRELAMQLGVSRRVCALPRGEGNQPT